MSDLLERETQDVRMAEAVALFCYQVKKWIGAFAAALGGLDTLVFAGGIGEKAPVVRARICDGLGFLGIELKEKRNAPNAGVISAAASRVAVRVIHTDEELMIAKMVCGVLGLGCKKKKRTMKIKTRSPELLRKMDAYWRAANYLSVGQVYLYDNPLLKRPLAVGDVKHMLRGHWGTIHEGGELDYSLSHSFGAAFDNPDLIVSCVVGDGETETGPLATACHSNKFLNPATE